MQGKIRIPSIAGQTDQHLTLPISVNDQDAWTEDQTSGFFTQTVSLTGMTTATMFFADADLSSAATADAAASILADWMKVDRVEGLQNQLKFYCSGSAPQAALPVTIRIVSPV